MRIIHPIGTNVYSLDNFNPFTTWLFIFRIYFHPNIVSHHLEYGFQNDP